MAAFMSTASTRAWFMNEVCRGPTELDWVRKRLVTLAKEVDPVKQVEWLERVYRLPETTESMVFVDEMGAVSIITCAST